jgi:hypothetical protein
MYFNKSVIGAKSKGPDRVSLAMPTQGVLPVFLLPTQKFGTRGFRVLGQAGEGTAPLLQRAT